MNIFSVDLEDYFMVSAFESIVKREDWERYESRIEQNTYRLLDILDDYSDHQQSISSKKLTTTFFCLGWIGERYPKLIKDIHARGHEIASHGYAHQMVTRMTPNEFREDVRRSRIIIEDLIGQEILGFRAPSYSIGLKTPWAFEILAEEGYSYDSSIFPVRHDRYGMPNAPRYPFLISFGSDGKPQFVPLERINPHGYSVTKHSNAVPKKLIEFPMSTLRVLGYNIPLSGGGYFRLYPRRIFQWAISKIIKKTDYPFIFYIHPWELDPQQPRIPGLSLKSRFRHYLNLSKTEGRLKAFLRRYAPFSSFRNFLINHEFF